MKKYHIISLFAVFAAALLFACRTEQPVIEPVTKVQDTVVQEAVKEKEQPVEPLEVQKPVYTIVEKYQVAGKNPQGTGYTGTLKVTKSGDSYTFTMKLPKSTIVGNGSLEGNKLMVSWGKNRRFEYEVKEDGKIISKWAQGEEIYTPEKE